MKNTIIAIIYSQILLLILTGDLNAAASKPELQKVRHTVLSSTSEQVTLQLNGSYIPKVFTLKGETPRIVFDFPDMTHSREVQGNATTNGTIVKHIRAGMHTTGGTFKTRIVFDVATLQGVTYHQTFDDKSSTLTIQFTTNAKIAAPVSKNKTASPSDKNPSKSADAAKKTDKQKTADTKPVQAPPAVTAESKAQPKTETVQTGNEAKSQHVTKEPILQQSDSAEKTEEKKTPAIPAAKSQSEATADRKPSAKTKPTQTESVTKPLPAAQEASPQPAVTVEKAEEKKTPAIPVAKSQSEATADSKASAKTKTTQTENAAKPLPAAQEASPQPAVTAEKAEEKKTPIPATTAPQPVIPTETKPSAKTEVVKPAVPPGETVGPLIESVKFDGTSPKGEMVLFKLNDFHPPVIHGVEEGVPRVICDFNSTQIADSVKNLIKADGKYVKIIRVTKHKKPERIRVVLDLEPNRSYDLQQVFFKEDNLFVIIVNTIKN